MTKNPVRRAQLIAPFGVGALMVLQNGTSVISGGLDHWYKHQDGTRDAQQIDLNEFRVEEWRLQQLLGVDHFRLPPDFRDGKESGQNKFLYVPCLRFPQWHFCSWCKRLEKQPLPMRERPVCPECAEKNRRKYLVQLPFVAMCDRGHLQDFPWREWVHQSVQPQCQMSIRLVATGGSSLAAQRVKCDCGAERTLAQITEASTNGNETELSKQLDKDGIVYRCQGQRPWLGTERPEQCDRPIRGSLRNASNLYFADVRSAIYLPRGTPDIPSGLVTMLEEPPLSVLVTLLTGVGQIATPAAVENLRSVHEPLLRPFKDEQIAGALRIVQTRTASGIGLAGSTITGDDKETAFRRAEFDALRTPREEDLLVITAPALDTYNASLSNYFSRVTLIHKLRETRALAGFTRVFPENSLSLEERMAMLRGIPATGKNNWISAYIVYGEGIFLGLDEKRLQTWERREDVVNRLTPLVERYKPLLQNKKLRERPLGPRFVLLHSLAHLIMNQLTFECGYSSAALRERLYVSENQSAPMAGILIYTAAGDSEGTMGGLVRMGKPGYLEPVIQQALLDAQWCSTDPVCMEMGSGPNGGQGPDACNLAACHNCSLVPETACEEFNRFLDRGVVVGVPGNRDLGYFDVDEMWRLREKS